jgi:hypothetical protein
MPNILNTALWSTPVVVKGYGGGRFAIVTPSLATVSAQGLPPDALTVVLPSFTLKANGGGHAVLSAPSMKGAGSGTVANSGIFDQALPMMTLAAAGTVPNTGNAAITFGSNADTYKLVGYSGAVLSASLFGSPSVQGTGTVGSVASVVATLPMFDLVATGSSSNSGSANLLLPAAIIGATAQAWIRLPMSTLVATGHAVVAVTYEAYALNLKHKADPSKEAVDELTRYTNYPFDRIVRYKNSYYGMNSTGLYLLEGTTDDSTPIPWSWKTHISDLGSPQKKTIEMAYFSGRFGPASTISLYVGEVGPTAYAHATPRGSAAQNYRQAFGRGLKSRYYALGATGSGDLTVDSITFNVAVSTRKV